MYGSFPNCVCYTIYACAPVCVPECVSYSMKVRIFHSVFYMSVTLYVCICVFISLSLFLSVCACLSNLCVCSTLCVQCVYICLWVCRFYGYVIHGRVHKTKFLSVAIRKKQTGSKVEKVSGDSPKEILDCFLRPETRPSSLVIQFRHHPYLASVDSYWSHIHAFDSIFLHLILPTWQMPISNTTIKSYFK